MTSCCPHCGAKIFEHIHWKTNTHWECGSWEFNVKRSEDIPQEVQSETCRIRELKQRNERLELVIKAARQMRDEFAETNRYIKGINAVSKALYALDKELGDG